MRKHLFTTLLMGVVIGLIGFCAFYYLSTAAHREMMQSGAPELAWMQREFNLTAAEFEKFSKLHASYLPQCKGGDSALSSLMERHAEKLFHYLVRQLGNEQDAEDLGQESFVRVFQHRARFDPAQKFTTWLYTIATNLSRDRLRYRARHPNV